MVLLGSVGCHDCLTKPFYAIAQECAQHTVNFVRDEPFFVSVHAFVDVERVATAKARSLATQSQHGAAYAL